MYIVFLSGILELVKKDNYKINLEHIECEGVSFGVYPRKRHLACNVSAILFFEF